MSDTLNASIDRRAFLRGASSALGAAVLSSSGLSRLVPKPAVISVAYFSGDHLIPADQVRAATVPLERAQLTMSSAGKGALTSVRAHFEVITKASVRRFPFLAWVAGGARTRFEMPVDPKAGLRLGVTQSTRTGAETADLQIGPISNIKLNEGTYVIAAGKVNWSLYRIVSGELISVSGNPSSLQHVFVTISRA